MKPIGAVCRIKWAQAEYTDEEDVLFLIGDSEPALESAEDRIVQKIEAGDLDQAFFAEVLVIPLHPLEWMVVRTGQRTSQKFVVVNDRSEHTYIY